MYHYLKKIIKKIVPTRLFFEQEERLRGCFSVFYKGNNFNCNICSTSLRSFIILPNNDTLCPNCGSLKRNRRLWSLLESDFLVPNSTILDFSPSRCLYRKMKKIENINYKSTDLSGDFIADNQFDITHLDLASSSLDLVVCYHILEHIDNDAKAMQELFRVMKPGAKALIQTPFKDGEIYENDTVTSSEDRLIHFGQEDHVRVYSVSGLKKRLRNSGFDVEVKTNFDQNEYNGFDENESILIAYKPLNK